VKRVALALAGGLALLAAGVAGWQVLMPRQTLPQYVEGPLSGFELGCQEDKQSLDRARFVRVLDLDGDGQPDHVFEIAQGCEANRLLYCSPDEGCLIDIFLSSTSMKQLGMRVKGLHVVQREGKPALDLDLAGAACAPAALSCRKMLVWNGQDLALR
jgi:hypothetical protein